MTMSVSYEISNTFQKTLWWKLPPGIGLLVKLKIAYSEFFHPKCQVNSDDSMAKDEPIHDILLIKQAKAGNERAYKQLYTRHSPAIFGFLLRILRHEASAEELLQEVFLRAFRSLRTFQERSSFKTWLFSITRNCLRSHWHSMKHQVSTENISEILYSTATHSPGFQQTEKQELYSNIDNTIQKMHPLFQEIFLLRYVSGLSYFDIATVLDIPIGTVKSRISRALKEFWMWYDKENIDSDG